MMSKRAAAIRSDRARVERCEMRASLESGGASIEVGKTLGVVEERVAVGRSRDVKTADGDLVR